MAERTVLNLYLSKVAEGDQSYLGKLCDRLADRLMCVPIFPMPAKKGSGRMTIQVFRATDEGREIYPIFTSERNLKNWATETGQAVEFISLLGADFCTAVGSDGWVAVDPGCAHAVLLSPANVHRISACPPAFDDQPVKSVELQPVHSVADKVFEVAEQPASLMHSATVEAPPAPVPVAETKYRREAPVESDDDWIRPASRAHAHPILEPVLAKEPSQQQLEEPTIFLTEEYVVPDNSPAEELTASYRPEPRRSAVVLNDSVPARERRNTAKTADFQRFTAKLGKT